MKGQKLVWDKQSGFISGRLTVLQLLVVLDKSTENQCIGLWRLSRCYISWFNESIRQSPTLEISTQNETIQYQWSLHIMDRGMHFLVKGDKEWLRMVKNQNGGM